jgi:hypothetical protein
MQEFAKRLQELLNQLKESDKGDKAGVDGTIKSSLIRSRRRLTPDSRGTGK